MLHPLAAPDYADRIGFAHLTRQAFEGVGNQVVPGTPLAALHRLYGAEVARYGAIVKSINLQPQQ